MFIPLAFSGRRHTVPLDADAAADIAARTVPLPRIVWIELTSRCPYDCPFCSRKTLRGHGENMPIALYRRIVAELGEPEVLRLNYSGESVHHPHIVEAVALAAATGAWVELVSVPAALAPDRLDAIVHAGLNRLTVSLHTLDPAQFDAWYRFGDLASMLANLRRAAALVGRTRQPFVVDLAFVATTSNLGELPGVAKLAAQLALPVLAVHPVIRRADIPERFAAEVDDSGVLRAGFRADLGVGIAEVRARHPTLAIEVSTPEIAGLSRPITDQPAPAPGALPAGARVHSCAQDPFETLHILANGKAVTCEVRDRQVVGDLAHMSVAELWHGAEMRDFRAAFVAGRDPHCRGCPYKLAYRPGALRTRVAAGENSAQLLHGWHTPDSGVVWSKRDAALLLARERGATTLALSGILPPGRDRDNTLAIDVDGTPAMTITNDGAAPLPFARHVPLPAAATNARAVIVRMHATRAWRPVDHGGSDVRALGFALTAAEIL